MTQIPPSESADTFQARATEWARSTFPIDHVNSPTERAWRFLEEAIELAQAIGIKRREASTLVEYVFARPTGIPAQEVGGTMTTLAVLCSTLGISLLTAAEAELARISTLEAREKVLRKHMSKPRSVTTPIIESTNTPSCLHRHLDMDGICHACGQDCR